MRLPSTFCTLADHYYIIVRLCMYYFQNYHISIMSNTCEKMRWDGFRDNRNYPPQIALLDWCILAPAHFLNGRFRLRGYLLVRTNLIFTIVPIALLEKTLKYSSKAWKTLFTILSFMYTLHSIEIFSFWRDFPRKILSLSKTIFWIFSIMN